MALSEDRPAGTAGTERRLVAGGRLPTFLVIGAMKAGTTSLYHYLRSHPHIFMPDTKEVMFFDPRHEWRRGVEWYMQQFEAAPPDALALGEASTSYTKYPVVEGVPERIAAVVPDVRLIYVLRHPVDRMRSHYLYLVSRGKEHRSIERAFAEDAAYLDTSRYAMQIEQYLGHIPLERFLFVDSRDLASRRAETLRTIYRFLGVDEDWSSPVVGHEFFRSSERRMKPKLTQRVRRIPGLASVVGRMPTSVRTLARKLPADRVDPDRGRLSEDLQARLEAVLAADVLRLRAFLPAEFDGWGIA
jgi:hypothetical protein